MMRKFPFCLVVVFFLTVLPAAALPVLAVMEFRTQSVSEDDALFLVDMLTSSMFRTGAFTVIDRTMREERLREIEYSMSDSVDEKTQIALGKQLAADLILVGRIGRYGEKVVISVKLIETGTGRLVSVDDEILGSIDEAMRSGDFIASKLVKTGKFTVPDAAAPVTAAGRKQQSVEDPVSETSPEAVSVGDASGNRARSTAIHRFPFQLSFWAPVQLVPSKTEITAARISLFVGNNAKVSLLDAGPVNIVGERMTGLEFGLVNITGAMYGFQFGLVNRTSTLAGVQVGLIGVSGRSMVGQWNMLVNVSESMGGIQAGFVNVAEKMSGVQFGLVNVAGVLRGLQVGLVNVVRYGENTKFMPLLNFSF